MPIEVRPVAPRAARISPCMSAQVRSHEPAASARSTAASQSPLGRAITCSAAATKFFGRRGDLDQSLRTIGSNHIDDGRRHDRHPCGKKLRGFGRADEARRLIERERHDADIPGADLLRQVRIGARPAPVDVGPLRQRPGIDLHHGTNDVELPVRSQFGRSGEQIEVEPLIDHAEKAELRLSRSMGLAPDTAGPC